MAAITRRGFVIQTAAGAATLGALAAVPGLAGRLTAEAHAAEPAHGAPLGPLVAHVRNAATGEIAVFVDTREIVIRDREVARRLLRAAR